MNNVGLFGLIETRVKSINISKVISGLGTGWSYEVNNDIRDGGRIWILWNPSIFNVSIIKKEVQVIHLHVSHLQSGYNWVCSMVYGCNKDSDRHDLWNSLVQMKAICVEPWIVMGDFNNVLHFDERIGSSVTAAEEGDCRVFSRIDRVMANAAWILNGPSGIANFLPEGLHDHSPCILSLWEDFDRKKNSFKYFNMWGKDEKFLSIVQQTWSDVVRGCRMFRVAIKLKRLKNPLKRLNREGYGDIINSASAAKMYLQEVQTKLHLDPRNLVLQSEEKIASNTFKELDEAKNLFLGQKAKIQWMCCNDDNIHYFHSSIRARRAQNKVLAIKDMTGRLCSDNSSIEAAFIEYYISLLGNSAPVTTVNAGVIRRGKIITPDQSINLCQPVTAAEIRQALFSIPNEKAPGPDGYSAGFFKDAFPVIGEDVIAAVMEFFDNGQLLQQINSTVLTLIPKKEVPCSVLDFRPIACCNVLFKSISKVICGRLVGVLADIISLNQSAFIHGRDIVDNIMICQDLVRLYNRRACSPRVMMKIDLRKAYDSIEWTFVEDMLYAFKFPPKMINWIMQCVTTPTYTISLNGSQFGYFKGRRGLRQGDPMSPLLFTLFLEYFTRILDLVTLKPQFRFHPLCKAMGLCHLAFADDLLIFCRGDQDSVKIIMRAFMSFSDASGLCMNKDKSDIFMNGVPNPVAEEILLLSGFQKGKFPFRYLGIPISYKRLSNLECNKLVEKMVERIRSSGAKHLTIFADWFLLEQFYLLHSYWARIFLCQRESFIRWSVYVELTYGPGKVRSIIKSLQSHGTLLCLPKIYGGLGIDNCHMRNIAMPGKYIWWVASKKDCLWVKWVHHVYIKQADWWLYTPSISTSWTWRQLCKVKDKLHNGFLSNHWLAKPYCSDMVYNWLLNAQGKKVWLPLVWNRLSLPKDNFICWLFIQQRLQTKDRLLRFGVINDGLCYLCGMAPETHSHLFFDCNFSARCAGKIRQWLGVDWHGDIITWGLKWHYKFLLKKKIILAVLSSLIYLIWETRNKCRVEQLVQHPDCLVHRVQERVKARMNVLKVESFRSRDIAWVNSVLAY
ncbi:uncharacterized protein LOC141590687 [Silene latifolia]|uniref:uncharacterized protein LOC141590687 n=1 Tax=Silene latifolia TaxID=37657 RepID=UPI003D780E4E